MIPGGATICACHLTERRKAGHECRSSCAHSSHTVDRIAAHLRTVVAPCDHDALHAGKCSKCGKRSRTGGMLRIAIASTAVGGGLFIAQPPADAVDVDSRPCASRAEVRELRAHDGGTSSSWSPTRVEQIVDVGGARDSSGLPVALSYPTCAPCDGLAVVAYFERVRGQLRLEGLSQRADFVENPPPAGCP